LHSHSHLSTIQCPRKRKKDLKVLLANNDRKTTYKRFIPNHFSFQNFIVLPSPKILLTENHPESDSPPDLISCHHNEVFPLGTKASLSKKQSTKGPYRWINKLCHKALVSFKHLH
jgi:hypothetical protein